MYAVAKETHNLWQFTKTHETMQEATEEAERLCKKENATFYVVELVKKCYQEEKPIKWVGVKEE